jgi:hypothetical protein
MYLGDRLPSMLSVLSMVPVLQKTTTNKFVCMYVCIYLGICMCHKDSDGSEKEEATFV